NVFRTRRGRRISGPDPRSWLRRKDVSDVLRRFGEVGRRTMTTTRVLPPVITIDGPTASGKGTIAHAVARSLGFDYLDSGSLYRLVAWRALRDGVALDDGGAVCVHA